MSDCPPHKVWPPEDPDASCAKCGMTNAEISADHVAARSRELEEKLESLLERVDRATPPTYRKWNARPEAIPNVDGSELFVLVRADFKIEEAACVVAKDADGRHFLSEDGSIEKHIPYVNVLGWRSR